MLLNPRLATAVAVAGLTVAAAPITRAATVTLSGYNFNTLTNGTTYDNTILPSSSGNGTLSISPNAATGVTPFAQGTSTSSTINGNGDPAGVALQFNTGAGTQTNGTGGNNGNFITFAFSSLGATDLTLSFAGTATSTGFQTVTASYFNGVTFTNIGSATLGTSYALKTIDLSSANVLENTSTAQFRLTFTGGTGTSGNTKLDNVRITYESASPVTPLPTAVWAGGAMLGGLGLRRRR